MYYYRQRIHLRVLLLKFALKYNRFPILQYIANIFIVSLLLLFIYLKTTIYNFSELFKALIAIIETQ